MRRKRLNEARSLLRGLAVPAPKKPCAAERSIHTGRADRHDVGIHHHVRHSPIALALVGDLDLESRVLLLQTSLLDIVSTLKGRSAVLRRTPSAICKTTSGEDPIRRTGPRPQLYPPNDASESGPYPRLKTSSSFLSRSIPPSRS